MPEAETTIPTKKNQLTREEAREAAEKLRQETEISQSEILDAAKRARAKEDADKAANELAKKISSRKGKASEG